MLKGAGAGEASGKLVYMLVGPGPTGGGPMIAEAVASEPRPALLARPAGVATAGIQRVLLGTMKWGGE